MTDIFRDAQKRIADDLWNLTKCDWCIQASFVFTEPVCPTVQIFNETNPKHYYSFIGNTLEETIESAVSHIEKLIDSGELVEREQQEQREDG